MPFLTAGNKFLDAAKALFGLCITAMLVFHSVPAQAQSTGTFPFASTALKGVTLTNPTSLQFGPDGRLYVAQQNGLIMAYRIVRNGLNDYTVTATETIDLINKIPNYDDNGALNPSITTRQVTGILVKGTAANPVIYVTSSDSRIGGPNMDTNLDTNSGILSVLTWNGTAWVKIDLVRGFPRSEENHSVNGIQIDDQTNTLLITVGGLTNAGAPSNNFAFITEYALAAAILSVDLDAINALPTKGLGNTAYKYDLPTLDDPTRPNKADGTDPGDPFGGNDGLNQAKLVPGAPVKMFAPGFRNAYDLVITKSPGKDRRVYTVDNGANQSWGGYPDGEGTATPTNNYVLGEPGSTNPGASDLLVNYPDNLHYIGNLATYTPGSFYGGHPTPLRANPSGAGLYTHDGTTGTWRTSKTGTHPLPQDWPPVSTTNTAEGNFLLPGSEDNSLLTFPASTNGIAEYTASNFNNALKGSLLVASFDGKIFRVVPNANGTDVLNSRNATTRNMLDAPFAANFGAQPLDVTTQGDTDIFPGTVWAATYGSNSIIIFEPQDFVQCSGLYNSNDDDRDGYTNADEMDNGTLACSAASQPKDNDGDFISDRNDPDDDNDGISDKADRFALDAQNGLETRRPLSYELFNNNPGTGLFGLGFTGLMSNNDSDYLHLFDAEDLIAGGAVGAFSVLNVSAGDALGTVNKQGNGFQFGFRADAAAGPYVVQGRLLGPFFNNATPKNFQSLGIFIGTGDQDNYIKIALNANGGQGGIEVVVENAGAPSAYQYPLPGGIPATSLELFLAVNPIDGTVQPRYSINNGSTQLNLGSPIATTGALRTLIMGNSGAVATGVISTSRGTTPFTATWDYLRVATNTATAAGSWQTVAPVGAAPLAREENGFVEAGNRFYLIGGRGIQPVQEYNPATRTWSNKAAPPLELHHFQALTIDGLIYVVGAFTGSYPRETPVANIYIYNPATDKWITGPQIPAGRRRGSAGAVVYNKKIYLVSGIQDGHYSGWVNWVDEFDPATGSWRILPDAPRARDHFHAVVANNRIYVAGGRRSSAITNNTFGLTVGEVDVFDFRTNQWLTLPAASNLPTKRAGAATTILGNELIVIGGESLQDSAHKETEAMDLTSNSWRRLANMVQARHGSQVINTNNGLYIVAGAGTRGGSMKLSSFESFYLFMPTTPQTPAITPATYSASAALNFGTVRLGDSTTQTLKLTSRNGNQGIVLLPATQTGATSFKASYPYNLPVVLPPNGNLDIPVTFKPATNGAHTGQLALPNSTAAGSTTTALSGTGATPLVMINAGGPQLTTSLGTFAADHSFVAAGSTTFNMVKAVAATTDDALYQTERAASASNGSFTYNIQVANGQYQVKLHFAEVFFTTVGARVFDVSIENTKVLNNYDIVARAGIATARAETFTTSVADGNLTIFFTAALAEGGVNRPKVSAIEIIPVSQSANEAPIANAGADKQVTLPVSSVSLSGSGIDPDGTITGYQWSQVSGPNVATFNSTTIASPAISNLAAGIYTFNLVVTDNLGASSGGAQVNVVVNGTAVQYTIPVYRINAGGGQLNTSMGTFRADTLFAPAPGFVYTKSVPIAGTTDDALYISERSSTVANGAFAYNIPLTNGNYQVVLHFAEIFYTTSGSRKFDVSVEGVKVLDDYDIVAAGGAAAVIREVFQTKVSDGVLNIDFSGTLADGGINRPKVSAIEIFAAAVPNQTPVANAGPDQTITLPVSSVVLNGMGDDTDGTISKYQWSQVLGPNTAIISNALAAKPTVSGLMEGNYVFQLIVTDNQNQESAADQVNVRVLPANKAPVASAGQDRNIQLPQNSVLLLGTATDADGTVAGYKWSQVSGPNTANFTSTTLAQPTVSSMVAGSYVFRLVATDNDGMQSAADDVTVTVRAANLSPIANAGADINLQLPNNATQISGAASADSDGTVASYRWTQVSGPATATFSSTTAAQPTVSALVQGTYVFRLVVTDNEGMQSAADDVQVTVTAAKLAPVANAGTDKNIQLPANTVQLTGSASDADGTIATYRWTQVSGPSTATFSATNVAQPTVSALVQGAYVFRLQVTDDEGLQSAPDDVTVSVRAANLLPTVNAGADQSIQLPASSVVLNGSANDADGNVQGLAWTQVSGPATAAFSSNTIATPTVSGLVAGTYIFQLVATDNQGAQSAADQVSVVVRAVNQAPVANAGADISTQLPRDSVLLQGSGTDADGTVTAYQWTQVSGPSTATIRSSTSMQTIVAALQTGTYTFQLVVTDNQNKASAPNQVVVTVVAANRPPAISAGADKTIQLPVYSTVLDGSASDPDGTIQTLSWTQVSGPAAASFSSAAVAKPTVSGLVAGVYVFRLAATDNAGLQGAPDDVTITVRPANIAPTADAGPDQAVRLPRDSTTLSGSGTDPDGTVTAYQWTQTSGPSVATIRNPGAAQTVVAGLQSGIYTFRLVATDNQGAQSVADNVLITVQSAPVAPVASAGPDRSIQLPVSSVQLDGSESADGDGTVATYRWTQVSGPSTATISATTVAKPTVSALVQGIYVFRLVVNDNEGLQSAADDVQVTVIAANIAPAANAGANKSIQLPTNSVQLNGSGTDADGTVAGYSWTQVSGPSNAAISGGTTAQATVSALVQGTYVFQLTVTDNQGLASTPDQVSVEVRAANVVPVANAGADQSLQLPTNSTVLDGSGNDPDGTISLYTWTQVSGPSQAQFSSTSIAKPNISALVQGSYTFRLVVTDNQGAQSTSDDVVVSIGAANQPPTANAGADQSIQLPASSVVLNGSANDADGNVQGLAWTQVSGPATAAFSSNTIATPTVSGLVAGTYIFQLVATDNQGAQSAADQVSVVVRAANQAPVARAGIDRTIQLPKDSVRLDGTASSDPDGQLTAYHWSQLSGPAASTLDNASSAQPVVSGLLEGVYTFQLVVTDNEGLASTANEVTITVNRAANVLPVADAGTDRTVTLPTKTTTLDGTGSFDPDGAIIRHNWTKLDGPAGGNIVNPNAATAEISNLQEGIYRFTLIVVDDRDGVSVADTVRVTVLPKPNKRPDAVAGSDVQIQLPVNTVTLDGSGSKDEDGTISKYRWSKVSGPDAFAISDPAAPAPTLSDLTTGTYVLTLVTVDNDGAESVPDEVSIIVLPKANTAPVAQAGPDASIQLPVQSILLEGSGLDNDGTIVAFNWTQVSGPTTASIATPTLAQTTVNELQLGSYVFALIVTDDNGTQSAADQVTITVQPANLLPVASAGNDRTVQLPTSTVQLDGSGSADEDGSLASYSWLQVSGPSTATFDANDVVQPTVSGLVAGTYTFSLVVIDNQGAESTVDQVIVTVLAANKLPIAAAGTDQTLRLPTDNAQLNGSGTDEDGTIATYTWTQVSGPTQANFSASDVASPTVSELSAGSYTFRLVVTDSEGATSAPDEVTVVVLAAPVAPVAHAGADRAIELPLSGVTLDGGGSTDADGTITGYQWTFISGPDGSSFDDPLVARTTVNGLQEGVYVFRLVVTDNEGMQSEADEVTITVLPEPNRPPLAYAGEDQTITLPTNNASLNGSGSDAGGSIETYRWKQVAGPEGAVIESPTEGNTEVTNLQEGTYLFTLEVTDDGGLTSAPDTVVVTVEPLPTNSVTGFMLLNATTEQPILDIHDGQVINLAMLPTRNLNIRVNTFPEKVGSVQIDLQGPNARHIRDHLAPYSVFGDFGGNLATWQPRPGKYRLTATPFDGSSIHPRQGKGRSISFTIIDQQPLTMLPRLSNIAPARRQLVPYPVPNRDGHLMVENGQRLQGTVQYRLVSASGATLTQGKLEVERNTSTLRFNFGPLLLRDGLYFLHLEQGGTTHILKVIMQR